MMARNRASGQHELDTAPAAAEAAGVSPFPFRRASDLDARPEAGRWLIEGLWSAEGVGIIGGEPKCCKSFLALELAVSVATGTPCLRRFPPCEKGTVLLYAAEDPLHVVRRRLEGIALASEVALSDLDLLVITVPRLRLDLDEDRVRLRRTVERTRPKLLILDPLVRLHRIDENGAGGMAELLGYLRELEREFQMAVVLVHHARKAALQARGGQALRGSSELHAWGDSNLYMRRRGEALVLTVEHRAEASPGPFMLELNEDGKSLALEVVDAELPPDEVSGAPSLPLAEQIISALSRGLAPMCFRALRNYLRVRNGRLSECLADLVTTGRVTRTDDGYSLSVSGAEVFPKGLGCGERGTGNGLEAPTEPAACRPTVSPPSQS